MKRTQYFQDRFVKSSIKRVTPDGKVTFFSGAFKEWRPSCYTYRQLSNGGGLVSGGLAFTRITRDEARKARPIAFRKPFNKA